MELNVQDQSGHWRNALEFLKIIFGYLDNQNDQIGKFVEGPNGKFDRVLVKNPCQTLFMYWVQLDRVNQHWT